MVICSECGKDVKEAKFCSNCGAILQEIGEAVEEKVEEVTPDITEEEQVVEEQTDEIVEEEAAEEAIEEEPAVEEPAEEEVNVVKKTKFCSNCGTQVDSQTVFCPQCGFKLIQEEKPQTKFCSNCGKKIDINAESCPYCGVRVANIRSSEEKNVLLSAILSIVFPGLGHIYLGLNKKGISFIIAYIISAILIFLLIGFVLVLIVWIWALIDSIKSTEAINRGDMLKINYSKFSSW